MEAVANQEMLLENFVISVIIVFLTLGSIVFLSRNLVVDKNCKNIFLR